MMTQIVPSPNVQAAPESDSGVRNARSTEAVGKRLQELLARAERIPNESARALVYESLQSLLAFYGDGLAQLLKLIRESPGGPDILERLAGDPLVSGVLLIHGLHPMPLETRLHRALEKLRPYFKSHGGNVELVSLQNDFARLRLQGTCKTCPSSSVTLELAVRRALEEACPDLLGFTVDGDGAPAEKGPAAYQNCGIATDA
jgi:Fe-S cluster biogenesis protein NfuA